MKILFVYPVPPFSHSGRAFHQGIGLLSSIARNVGHETALSMVDGSDTAALESRIRGFKPDLIAISTTTDQFPLTAAIAHRLREISNLPLLLGGVHPTAAPSEALSLPGLLGIVVGEGEETFREILAAMEKGAPLGGIQNFWYNEKGKIVRNPLRPPVRDLDGLPFPDREIFQYEDWLEAYKDGLEFIAGRGCPYTCGYCIEAYLKTLYGGKGPFVRMRSVENLLEEMGRVVKKYPRFRIITFHDDIFGLDRKWLKAFSRAYAKAIGMPYRVNARADLVDEESVTLLKESGCTEVWIGVETGNEKLRKTVLDKNISDEVIKRAFHLAKAAGLKTMAFNMIGLPGETPAQVRQTFSFNREIQPDRRGLNIFRPYPGTRLHALCEEKGWISKRTVKGYFGETVLDQPSISRTRLEYYRRLFPHYFSAERIPFRLKLELWLKALLRNRPGVVETFRKLKRMMRR